MELLVALVSISLDVVLLLLILRIVILRLPYSFGRIGYSIFRLSEPLLKPLRRIFRRLRFDISPYVAIGLALLARIVLIIVSSGDWVRKLQSNLLSIADLVLILVVVYLTIGLLIGNRRRFKFSTRITRYLHRVMPVKNRVAQAIIYVAIAVFLHSILTFPLQSSNVYRPVSHSLITTAIENFLISASVLTSIFYFLLAVVIVSAILTWINPNPLNPLVQIVWELSSPLIRPFQRVLPPVGALDFSATLAALAIWLALKAYISAISWLLNLLR